MNYPNLSEVQALIQGSQPQPISEKIMPIIKEQNHLRTPHLRSWDLILYSISACSKVNSDLWKVFGKWQESASDSSIQILLIYLLVSRCVFVCTSMLLASYTCVVLVTIRSWSHLFVNALGDDCHVSFGVNFEMKGDTFHAKFGWPEVFICLGSDFSKDGIITFDFCRRWGLANRGPMTFCAVFVIGCFFRRAVFVLCDLEFPTTFAASW